MSRSLAGWRTRQVQEQEQHVASGRDCRLRCGCCLFPSVGKAHNAIVADVSLYIRTCGQAIFLDESAGQCCHSGCDNCEWRYDFDVMRAARPKWLVRVRVCLCACGWVWGDPRPQAGESARGGMHTRTSQLHRAFLLPLFFSFLNPGDLPGAQVRQRRAPGQMGACACMRAWGLAWLDR